MDRCQADRQIAVHAAAQYGVFTRKQARAAGLTDRQLRFRIETGRIERLTRHVFRIAGCAPSWRQQLMAACLAAGDGAVASHRSAAALHRYDGFGPGIVEITVPHTRRDFTMAGVIVHSSSCWADEDITTIDTIPVSTPERTLATLGAVVSDEQLEHALDSAERDHTVTRSDVTAVHDGVRQRGRNGVAAMARILDRRTELAAIPHSVLERRFLNLLQTHGIELPECQVPIRRPDGHIAYLDGFYRRHNLGIELDGNIAHATPHQRSADNTRANALALHNIHLIRFTYEQVTRQPDHVAATIRAHLHARHTAA